MNKHLTHQDVYNGWKTGVIPYSSIRSLFIDESFRRFFQFKVTGE